MPDLGPVLAGRRILVVEDEYLIAMEIKRWLREAGAEVLGPVPSVERTRDLIAYGPPDAAVLDINLGAGQTVYPVADQLVAHGVPFLFATGDVKQLGASAYRDRPRLEKPFVARDLVSAVETLGACRS